MKPNWITLLCLLGFVKPVQAQWKVDFSNGLPIGWQQSGRYWRFDDPYDQAPLASPSGQEFATFAHYFYASLNSPDTSYLQSPVTALPSASQYSLTFYHYYYFDSPEGVLKIEISEGGKEWSSIFEKSQGEADTIPVFENLDLTALVANWDSIQVRLVGVGQGNNLWVLDDLSLLVGEGTPPQAEHTYRSYACESDELSFSISADDLSGLSDVQLIYQFHDQPWDTIISNQPGFFEIVVPAEHPQGILQYQWHIYDASPNRNLAVLPAPNRFYSQYYGAIASSEAYLDFEHSSTLAYQITNSGGDFQWMLTDQSYDNGTQSLMVDLYSANTGDRSSFTVGPIQVEENSPWLSFSRAYAGYRSFSDTLRVYISSDRGTTWSGPWWEASGPRLATVPTQESYFVPQPDEWQTDSMYLEQFVDSACILLRFETTAGNGNNLYLDNLAWQEGLSPNSIIQLLSPYPNPSDGNFAIDFYLPELSTFVLTLMNVQGKEVWRAELADQAGWVHRQINLGGIRPGLYLLSLQALGQSVTLPIGIRE